MGQAARRTAEIGGRAHGGDTVVSDLALRGVGAGAAGDHVVVRERRPVLVVLPGGGGQPDTRTLRLRGRAVAIVLALVLCVALAAGAAIGRAGASPTPAVIGAVTIEPGQTLWDVAVANAPAGTDPRSYVADLRRVNDVDGHLQPWTVVLLPAPRG